MGKLTTHVLDTAHGKPGAGIAVALYRMNGYDRQFVSGHTTNADGRCDQPLLDGMFNEVQHQVIEGAGEHVAKLRNPANDAEDLTALKDLRVTAGAVTTFTDADGNYRLTGVPTGPVTV